jgi:hypothetical protein
LEKGDGDMLTDMKLDQIYTNAYEFDELPDAAEVCGLVAHIRTIQQQNKQLIEALEKTKKYDNDPEISYADYWAYVSTIIDNTLKSIQGGTPNA